MNNKNRGMALPIVMMFIFLISIAAVTLLRSSRQDLPQSFESLKHLQMKYIAKGAMQHARLKMTLLSTQAYDAAAYAVGKNPYYDHSAAYAQLGQPPASFLGPNDASNRGIGTSGIVTNPGPAFISGAVVVNGAGEITDRSGEHQLTFGGFDNQWDGGDFPSAMASAFDVNNSMGESIFSYGDNRYVGNLALVRFFEDISTIDPLRWNGAGFADQTGSNPFGFWPGSQQAVHIVSDVIDPVTGVADMFSASYDVRGMRVLATTGSRLYGSEAVSVTARVIIYTRGWSTNSTPPAGGQRGVQDLGGASFVESVAGTLEETSVFIVERQL
jgi:hypothetical protein